LVRPSEKEIGNFNLGRFAKGKIHPTWFHIIDNGIGEPIRVPILVARGKADGPVLGLTAAVHGNELNGIPVIQQIFRTLDVNQLRGTIVGVLAVNIPAVLMEQRRFIDDVDLNRIAPGKLNGNVSETYIYRFIENIVTQFDFLIDLHTASFGRVNSYYVRADMSDPATARMARLQNPDIILNDEPSDRSLRGTAASMGIKSITVEMKDPHVFQKDVIENGLEGITNVLCDLDMQSGELSCYTETTILCDRSTWIYTDVGGILYVRPKVTQLVEKGDRLAIVRDIFGNQEREYKAPEKGVIIGKSTNPVNQTGSRIVHLGLNPQVIPCLP
jgi:hypothetical protein